MAKTLSLQKLNELDMMEFISDPMFIFVLTTFVLVIAFSLWMYARAWGQWWGYREDMVANDRDEYGVYELADENKNTVYYGSGKVKTRLLDHLHKNECPMARIYRVEYFTTEAECRAKEQQLLGAYKNAHNGKLPMYNERMG